MRRWVRRLGRVVTFAATLAVVVPVFQVLFVRFVDPPFTLTMVQRLIEGDGWPRYESPPLAELGREGPRAFVASEDARFFLHAGFDWEGICDALDRNAKGGRLRGGSTISQQVAKNVFLWQGRSWLRKGLEAWYTVWLELLVPKERILELYVSVAETGRGTFGLEAGAKHHYGKSARRLSADEAGRLAGILPDPRRRSVKGDAARERASWLRGHPAPFPGDVGYERVLEGFRAERHGPWDCLGG